MDDNSQQNASTSMHDILETPTETKEATEVKTKAWHWDEDVKLDEGTGEYKTESSTQTSTASTETKKAEPQQKNTNPELAKISAETAVASIDTLIDLAGSFVVSLKCKNKFTPEEFKKAKSLRDTPIDTLSSADLALRAKFLREVEKKDEKIKELPFTPTETDRMVKIFERYYTVTGKTLSPEWMLVANLSNIVLDRAALIFMD